MATAFQRPADSHEDATRMMDITFGNVTPIRQAFTHNHPLGEDSPDYAFHCNACRVGRRLHLAVIQMEPYDPDWGSALASPSLWPDFASYVRLAWCKVHGLEAVTDRHLYRTGYDTGEAGEFACGAIVEEDVF